MLLFLLELVSKNIYLFDEGSLYFSLEDKVFDPEDLGVDIKKFNLLSKSNTKASLLNRRAHFVKGDEFNFYIFPIGLREGMGVINLDKSYQFSTDDSNFILGAAERMGSGIERKKSILNLEKLAYLDSLTGIPNRAHLYNEVFPKILSKATRDSEYVVMGIYDLDNFKGVNDGYGHDAGDHLLKESARRVKGCLRGHDELIRLGGDEFALVLHSKNDIDCDVIGEKILSVTQEPVIYGENVLPFGLSIGFSKYRGTGLKTTRDELDTLTTKLMKHADLALYHAKNAGRGRYHEYVES